MSCHYCTLFTFTVVKVVDPVKGGVIVVIPICADCGRLRPSAARRAA